jgi:signal peptide peptidase SppA
MRIIDIINGPWAITPEMLQEVQNIYSVHLRGEKIDISAVEAAVGRSLDNSSNGSWVQDGVAVIPINGVIAKKMNLFTQISGGVSSQVIAEDFSKAMNDPAIKGIVLHVDESPGGTVGGIQQAADIMASYLGTKPVVTCADGLMASAAYWIGSVADEIYIADLTTEVGSIGVVAKHMDISGYEEKNGIKTTEITAGQYKRAVSQYKPLSEEGRALIQADLDQIYALFVETVASNRGVEVADVLSNMADGRVFLGKKAIEAGLVDGVSTLAECIDRVKQLSSQSKSSGRAGVVAANQLKGKTMDIETLKAEHPDLLKQIQAEVREGMVTADDLQTQIEAARMEGATAEIDRIKDVRAQSVPGHEALIEQLAFDGKSTGADAALAIVAAEQKKAGSALKEIEAEANEAVVPTGGDDNGQRKISIADFKAMDLNEQRAFAKAGGKIIG